MGKKVYALAALLFCGAVLPACTDKEDVKENNSIIENVKQQTLSLTINASKNKNSKISKALAESGQNLAATWGENDEVSVYDGETLLGTLKPQTTGETSTVLSGNNLQAPTGTTLTLKFNTPNYANQDGTLEYIAANCDYVVAELSEVKVVDGEITYKEDYADFINQQAIVKFTLKNGDADFSATSLKVNDYTVTASSATNVFYVAIPATSDVALVATVSGGNEYAYTKTGANFSNGNFYNVTVKTWKAKLVVATASNITEAISIFNSSSYENPTLKFNSDYTNTSSDFLTITRNDGVIDLNNHSCVGKKMLIKNTDNSKTITIQNGTIHGLDGNTGYTDTYAGKIKLINLTVNDVIWTDGHEYIIESGTYSQIYNGYGNKTISAVSGLPNKVIINGGSFKNISDSKDNKFHGTYVINGGKFAQNVGGTIERATITLGTDKTVQDSGDTDYPYEVK